MRKNGLLSNGFPPIRPPNARSKIFPGNGLTNERRRALVRCEATEGLNQTRKELVPATTGDSLMTNAQLEHRIRILQDGLDAKPVAIDGEALRRSRGPISQSTIAKDVLGCLDDGRTRRCDVSRWERGIHRPTWFNLCSCCEYIGADPLGLLVDPDEIRLVENTLLRIEELRRQSEFGSGQSAELAASEP